MACHGLIAGVRPLAAISALACCALAFAACADDRLPAGRQIYEAGQLASGVPLVARWPVGVAMQGRQAACIQCHRASGSGAIEGGSLVPPVTGPALFTPQLPADTSRLPPGLTARDFHFLTRQPYDLASLARTLRTGVTPAGQVLSSLMPRYDLAPADMEALGAYLRQLSARPSPGIEGEVVYLATVVTPAASRQERQGLVEVLNACLDERHPADRQGARPWRLQVWDLHGDPAGWDRQLTAYAARRPVYAVLSGLGGADWAPVHQYCERARLPCLFPAVDAAGSLEAGRYSFYFSAGTPLEGQVMAHWLLRQDGPGGRASRVVQVYPAGSPAARAGARALADRAAQDGMAVVNRALQDLAPETLAAAVADAGPGDALALWLTPQQLERLVQAHPEPPPAGQIIASGWLGDAARLQVSGAWRERLRLVYPFDPPARLEQRMRLNLRPWLQAHRIAPARERVLGGALAACNLLAEGIAAQRGVLTRDKLVEQIENYPSGMGNAPAPQVFHNFSLGPGQRFSAKGAFVVRFAEPGGQRLEPLGELIVP